MRSEEVDGKTNKEVTIAEEMASTRVWRQEIEQIGDSEKKINNN